MGLWDQRLETSPVLALAREAKEILESRDTTSLEERDHADRQLRILDLIESTLTSVDPLLVSEAVLGALQPAVQQTRDHLNQWKTNNGSTYLTQHAAAAIDATLGPLGSIPLPATVTDASAEIASLRRSVGQHRGQVEREIESLRASVQQAQQEFTTAGEKATTRVSELEAEITRLRQEASELTAASREQGNQQQNAFSSAQTERQESFNRLLDEKRSETTVLVSSLKEQVAEAAATARQDAEDDLNAVAVAKQQVEDILGIVGQEALSGTYSKNATDEQAAANLWRWIAFGAIAAAVAVGVWLVSAAHGSGTDWDLFAAKLTLAVPIGGFAAYAARQSSEHRHVQRDAEHVALQLAALGPYLNNLDKIEDRDQLLIEIARRLFGHPRNEVFDAGALDAAFAKDPSLMAQLVPLLQQLAKVKDKS